METAARPAEHVGLWATVGIVMVDDDEVANAVQQIRVRVPRAEQVQGQCFVAGDEREFAWPGVGKVITHRVFGPRLDVQEWEAVSQGGLHDEQAGETRVRAQIVVFVGRGGDGTADGGRAAEAYPRGPNPPCLQGVFLGPWVKREQLTHLFIVGARRCSESTCDQ